jgi:hypothetical protein
MGWYWAVFRLVWLVWLGLPVSLELTAGVGCKSALYWIDPRA